MGLTIKANDQERELAPEGTHGAVCCRVLDLGTQHSEQWGDKRKLNLAFELVDEETEEGEPFVVYKQYNATISNKSTLGLDLKSWLNLKLDKDTEFDVEDLLGKTAMITVVHNETDNKVYANVDTITSAPKGLKIKKGREPLVSLYLNEDFDQEVFNDLPDFLKEKISATPEYEALGLNKPKGRAKQSKMDSQANPVPVKKGRSKK